MYCSDCPFQWSNLNVCQVKKGESSVKYFTSLKKTLDIGVNNQKFETIEG